MSMVKETSNGRDPVEEDSPEKGCPSERDNSLAGENTANLALQSIRAMRM
jgi:hypothetical protein